MSNLWIVNHLITKELIIRTYFKNNKIGEVLLDARENIILEELKKKYSDILKQYSIYEEPQNTITSDCPIWIFWGQGEDQMPSLVRCCYQSILKNAKEHPVHLITIKNYYEYVDIPNYIIEKFNEGKITWTTFSDIIRVSLLAKWGGLWLDATIYLTQPLPDSIYNGR